MKYVQDYPPRTRALLGALLESINWKEDLSKLKESINSLTTFKLGITIEILPNSKDWFIK